MTLSDLEQTVETLTRPPTRALPLDPAGYGGLPSRNPPSRPPFEPWVLPQIARRKKNFVTLTKITIKIVYKTATKTAPGKKIGETKIALHCHLLLSGYSIS